VTLVPRTLAVALPDLPEVADHTIQGKATVPAAWLLDLLIRTATEHTTDRAAGPATLPLVMREALFPRFLPKDEVAQCTFNVALEDVDVKDAQASTRATLTSRIALAGGICRTRTHAAVTLGGRAMVLPLTATAIDCDLDCDLELSPERAYAELIPFGPRYRNLHGAIRLGRGGGTAWVGSPEPAGPEPSRAGCPHLFDSAMHLACLWGQRYAGVVTYPTGFSTRVITSPLAHGQRRCVVVPTSAGKAVGKPIGKPIGLAASARGLTFDLWLSDENHRVCDAIVGLAMVPLARGAQPPAWIVHPQTPNTTP